MKVSLEDISGVTKKLTVVIPWDEVEKEMEKAFVALKKNAKIRGFRPGKAPMDFIKQRFSEEIKNDVAEKLFGDSYPKALDETKVNPLTYPQVDTEGVVDGKDFTYTATVEIMPQLEIETYRDVEVEKEKLSVDKKQVDAVLNRLADSHATLITVESKRAVKKGDITVITFSSSEGETPIEGASAENYPLDVGAEHFSADFDSAVIGMKPGEDKTFDVVFPEDHDNEIFAGKRITFQVHLAEIKIKEVPKIDDEFAKDLGDFENLKDLKNNITEDITKREETRITNEFEQRMLGKLLELNEFDPPRALVDEHAIDIIRGMEMRMRSQGASLEAMGLEPEVLMNSVRPRAHFEVKSNLLVDAIATRENIDATIEEARERLKTDAEMSGASFEELEERFESQEGAWDNLRSRIRTEKTLDFLSNVVKIKEVKKITQPKPKETDTEEADGEPTE
ncbi:MAG: trigger factor [Deltaproteobacteria bacterium]|nr:trigger factor [Candidatus Zymogenaceae bacterium]